MSVVQQGSCYNVTGTYGDDIQKLVDDSDFEHFAKLFGTLDAVLFDALLTRASHSDVVTRPPLPKTQGHPSLPKTVAHTTPTKQ